MKSIKTIFALLITLSVMLGACTKKDELTIKTYYAKVTVDVAQLPGTPELEVRYGGIKIGDAPLSVPGTPVEASANTSMSVYVKGTDELVADTILNLKKGEQASYKVAYNKELGISGWISSKPVSPDSVSVQILNNLSDYYKAYPAYDLEVFYYDWNTGEIIPVNFTIANFQNVKLSTSSVTLPYYYDKPNLISHVYLGKLKDRTTGQYIVMPSGDFFILEPGLGGATIINNVNDVDGEISAPAIYL